MSSAILVHPKFDAIWPLVADHVHRLWRAQGEVDFVRVAPDESRAAHEILSQPDRVKRLLILSVSHLPFTQASLESMTGLRELGAPHEWGPYDLLKPEILEAAKARGVRVIKHVSEGFWGQPLAEFGLALTLAALRRIPQKYQGMLAGKAVWPSLPPDGIGRPGEPGLCFKDDPNFANGTIAGKRVRIIGAGNIASRYASFVHFLGADVAAWDPFASEPCFHRAGARREFFLDRLVKDAEIFCPMVPLTDKTTGLVTAAHIEALPKGALVVLVTRAGIVDMPALRRRVLNDELSLAADVFDVEPLPPDDPLLGRHNVVRTPHLAGGTGWDNARYAEMLTEQFQPVF